jgi:hypothetical protein
VVGTELEGARQLLRRLPRDLRVRDVRGLSTAFWAADLCLTHRVYLEAIQTYLEAGGGSRGSVLVLDHSGELPCTTLGEEWRFARSQPETGAEREILEVWVDPDDEVGHRWVSVRPVPVEDGWFEEVWREYRAGRIVR